MTRICHCPECGNVIFPGQSVVGVDHDDPWQAIWHRSCHEKKSKVVVVWDGDRFLLDAKDLKVSGERFAIERELWTNYQDALVELRMLANRIKSEGEPQ
jgi:hypothetical protein